MAGGRVSEKKTSQRLAAMGIECHSARPERDSPVERYPVVLTIVFGCMVRLFCSVYDTVEFKSMQTATLSLPDRLNKTDKKNKPGNRQHCVGDLEDIILFQIGVSISPLPAIAVFLATNSTTTITPP